MNPPIANIKMRNKMTIANSPYGPPRLEKGNYAKSPTSYRD